MWRILYAVQAGFGITLAASDRGTVLGVVWLVIGILGLLNLSQETKDLAIAQQHDRDGGQR